MLLTLAGIMNIPNFLFFAGPDYSNRQEGTAWHLRGSAACNVHEWVPCMDCLDNSPLHEREEFRLQTVTNDDGQVMTFVLKNMCDGAKFSVGKYALEKHTAGIYLYLPLFSIC